MISDKLKEHNKRQVENSKWYNIFTKQNLEDMYLNKNMSQMEISKRYKVNVARVHKYIKKFKIKKRPFLLAVEIGRKKMGKKKMKKVRSHPGKTNPMYGKVVYPKRRFVEKLGHNVRSKWEEYIASILNKKRIDYGYESINLKLPNGKTYTPDFVYKNKLIEVKGPVFSEQKKKMTLIEKEYPEYDLCILTHKRNKKYLSSLNLFLIFQYYGHDNVAIDNNELQRFLLWLNTSK